MDSDLFLSVGCFELIDVERRAALHLQLLPRSSLMLCCTFLGFRDLQNV